MEQEITSYNKNFKIPSRNNQDGIFLFNQIRHHQNFAQKKGLITQTLFYYNLKNYFFKVLIKATSCQRSESLNFSLNEGIGFLPTVVL